MLFAWYSRDRILASYLPSRGSVERCQRRFPYAQMLAVLLIGFMFLFPMMVCYLNPKDKIFSPLLSFVGVLGLWSLNELAVELEMPFGDDENDLPLVELHDLSLRLQLRSIALPSWQPRGKFALIVELPAAFRYSWHWDKKRHESKKHSPANLLMFDCNSKLKDLYFYRYRDTLKLTRCVLFRSETLCKKLWACEVHQGFADPFSSECRSSPEWGPGLAMNNKRNALAAERLETCVIIWIQINIHML